jgi:medium-chain acyl-[acyl-carrier-protein] hydrolase
VTAAPTRPLSTSLVRLGARGTPRRRLICLPFAGGGVAPYRPWLRALPDDVELLAAALPGRETRLREQPLEAIDDMVEAIAPAVAAVAGELPYAIFGHSMGALVAFELTLALESLDVRGPSHLFVSAHRPPDEAEELPPINDLPDAEFLDELQRRYNAVPEAVRSEPELLALLLPALRADLRAIERYMARPGTRVRCPVHVYGGLDDRHPVPAQLPGWTRVAERPIRTRLFAGDHFYLTSQRDALAADIAAHWRDVGGPEAG